MERKSIWKGIIQNTSPRKLYRDGQTEEKVDSHSWLNYKNPLHTSCPQYWLWFKLMPLDSVLMNSSKDNKSEHSVKRKIRNAYKTLANSTSCCFHSIFSDPVVVDVESSKFEKKRNSMINSVQEDHKNKLNLSPVIHVLFSVLLCCMFTNIYKGQSGISWRPFTKLILYNIDFSLGATFHFRGQE